MKHYLILLGALAALSITQTTFSDGKPAERRAEERARILEAREPSERIKGYEAELKTANTEAEKKYFEDKLKKARNERDFWARTNTVSAAARNSELSSKKSPESVGELRGNQGKGKGKVPVEDHGAEAMAAHTGTGGRAVVEAPRSLAEKLAIIEEYYKVRDDAESAKLLKSTAEGLKGNAEAEAGLSRLLDLMITSKGNTKDFLQRLTELTKKNGLGADETLEIYKSMCATGCVANRGACRIGSQIARGLASMAGLTLSAYVLSGLEFKAQNGKQQCTVLLDKKDGSGKKEVTVDIKDEEQPEEKFPANPEKTG